MDGWRKVVINSDTNTLKFQSWDVSTQIFEDKFVLNNAEIEIDKDYIKVFSDKNKKRVMSTISKGNDREVHVSTFLYDGEIFISSQHENFDLIFEF